MERFIPVQTTTQTGQNPASAATVSSIRLTKSERELVKQDEVRKRKAYLEALEADAKTFVKGYYTAKAINDEANVLYRKFKEVVEEMRPVFERVKYGFAHLKKGETVMGERTGPAWAARHLGITYDWLCRCLKPPRAGRLLLTDGRKVLDPPPAKPDGSHEETSLRKPIRLILDSATADEKKRYQEALERDHNRVQALLREAFDKILAGEPGVKAEEPLEAMAHESSTADDRELPERLCEQPEAANVTA